MLDFFVPPNLRGDVHAERRVRFVTAVGFISAIGLAAGMAARGALMGIPTVSLIAHSTLLATFLLTPWLVRWSGRLSVGAMAYALGTCADVMVVAFQNAGPDTPITFALVLLPPFVTFIASARTALLVTLVAVAEMAVLLYFERSGFEFPMSAAALMPIRAIAMMILLVLLFVIAWLYERRRREAEEVIRQSEQRYVLATEASSEGVFDWDFESATTIYSDRFGRLLGDCADAPLVGMPLGPERVAEADRDLVGAALSAHLYDQAPLDIECRLLDTGGEPRWFQVRAAAVRDRDNQPTRLVGTIQDIGTRKETEYLKAEFISTVNHELRTPLASIHGALGLLNGGVAGELPEEARGLVAVAHRNSEHLRQMVEDLLTLQRVDAGEFSVELADVSLESCVEEALSVMRTAAPEAVMQVAIERPGIVVRADAKRLGQVVLNLLSNATKFAPLGSPIQLRLYGGQGATARLSVSDAGQGLASEHHDRVFDRFIQIDNSASRNHAGSGLGLSLARELMRAMHGDIGVTSELGAGATFWLELPTVVAAPETA